MAEIDDFLTSERFCHLGCCDGGKPYVVPLAYVFHGNAIYGQTTEGKKVDILRKNPLACFQLHRQEQRQWRSVMCWGTFEEFDFEQLDKAEAMMVIKLLTKRLGEIQDDVGIAIPRYSFDAKPEPLLVHNRKSTLFRILITEKTGKLYAAGE